MNNTLSTMICLAIYAQMTACGDQTKTNIGSSKVANPIMLKEFATGVKLDGDLKRAVTYPSSWSYFGAKRTLTIETTADGTVASIAFVAGDSFTGYKLKESLAEKFKQDGNKDFTFDCQSESDTASVANIRIKVQVTKETCSAKDGRQTLEIKTQHLKYEEPVINANPQIKPLFEFTKVILFDAAILKKIKDEKDLASAKSIIESNKKSKRDI